MLLVPQFELIEWRMTEKYCPITAEHELSIVSIIHGEKIWAIRAQCKASCKYGKKPRHSSTQESLGSCTGPIQEFGDDGFMIWMVGSIVHLFSIGITFSALWQPISTLHGIGKGLCVQQAKSFHSYELQVYVCSKQNPFIHMSFLGLFYLHNSLPTWDFIHPLQVNPAIPKYKRNKD
ncbi:unnamed protein product [Malus baccata var. baccata]